MITNRPIKAGITGGIGSGKTIVCEVFMMLGVPVYLADERAKYLMNTDSGLKEKIIGIFGADAYLDSGELNRNLIAERAFYNGGILEELNTIVHPAVEQDFVIWTSQHADASYILKEAALLVETGSYKNLDFLITVTAPEAVRVGRVLSRDSHRKSRDVKAIISRQLADSEKVQKSQFVILNDDKKLIIPQVLKIHSQFINSAQIR